MFENKKIPISLYWFLAILSAVVGIVLLFCFWGVEWYQENEMEWENGIFSIVSLVIYLIPFLISVVGGGLIGFFAGEFIAFIIDSIVAKLCEIEVDTSGVKKILTKPRKVLLVIVAIIVAISTIFITSRIVEKQMIKNEITNYLSLEFGLEDIEIKFIEPYSDTWKYGAEVYSSNLDSLSYEEMTRIVYYMTSHTKLDSGVVFVNRFLCKNDTYEIFTTSVYKNDECVYEYKEPPNSYIISADAPYDGMDVKFIGGTRLGSPDKTELCLDYYSLRPERRSIKYKWYDSKGKLIFSAFALGGKVVSITDFRE